MLPIFSHLSVKTKIWFFSTMSLILAGLFFCFLIFKNENIQPYFSFFYIGIGCIILIFVIFNKIILANFMNTLELIITDMRELSSQSNENFSAMKDSFKNFNFLTGKQLDDLKDIFKLIADISGMLSETTRNSGECRQISDKVMFDVNEGNEIMQKMVEAVLTIEKTKSGLEEIANLIKKISDDTSAIHTIVTTTELLSLNASIEAARAGTSGKGFSVVAEEVGNLAKNSGREAKEIEEIVLQSQRQISKLIETNQARVEVGKVASNDALALFNAIKNGMFGISSHSENIKAATWEQKLGVDQMGQVSFDIRETLKKNLKDTQDLLKIYGKNEDKLKQLEDVSYVFKKFWEA